MTPEERAGPPRAESGPDAASGNGAHADEADPLAELAALLEARGQVLVGAVRRLIAVHADRAQLAVRRRVQAALVAVVGACACVTLVVYATVHVVRGAAEGLGDMFQRPWLGSLAAGLAFLLLTAAGLALALRRWDRRHLHRQEEKYAAFDEDVRRDT